MTKSGDLTAKGQVRGNALKKRIEAVIKELAEKSLSTNNLYVYNATKVAEAVPTTRKTLARYEELVAKTLDDIDARRRMTNGNATVEILKSQLNILKEKLKDQEKQLDSYREHHIYIYKQLHAHSLNFGLLIRPGYERLSLEAGKCLFCNTKTEDTSTLIRESNVISILNRKPLD
jgi:hypothetical protein